MKKTKPKKEQDFFETSYEQLSITLPFKFLLLCKVLGLKPANVLQEFMNYTAKEIRGDNDKARTAAEEYFLACGYGQNHYTPDDLRLMLKELDALRLIWPEDKDPMAEQDLIKRYSQYHKKYCRYWFTKWFNKVRKRQ